MDQAEVMRTLAAVVGADHVSDDLVVRQCYGRDPHPSVTLRKLKRDPLTVPDIVAMPGDEVEVKDTLAVARRYGYNVIPMCSGDNLVGACFPTRPRTMIMDLKRLDTI